MQFTTAKGNSTGCTLRILSLIGSVGEQVEKVPANSLWKIWRVEHAAFLQNRHDWMETDKSLNSGSIFMEILEKN